MKNTLQISSFQRPEQIVVRGLNNLPKVGVTALPNLHRRFPRKILNLQTQPQQIELLLKF